jgi:TolB-like protein/Tfp pilus assembly protein PilF
MTEQRAQRRLAAILAADVVGYSRLMEQDEAETLAVLKERRKAILGPLVSAHHGRIVKVMGDGVLVEFTSAVNAVACAVALQQRMAEANEGIAADRQIVLRIGINVGDVIVEGGDIYGDGVNIAARLQEMSEPGGICIAGAVYDQVETKLALACEDLGACEIRNLARPVRVFRVVGGSTGVPAFGRTVGSRPSIAVLPFTNLSGDPTQQYFSDGITEDIITELSRWRQLQVLSRHASFQYRGQAVDVKRIGRELGAQYVVEGSVRRIGERIRITAQLIDAVSGSHVWAERYDRDLSEIFAVQDDVVRTIVGTLVGRVQAAGVEHAKRKPPASLAAYDYVLRGHALPWGDPQADAEACRMYEKAIEIDPGYGLAHGLLALMLYAEWTQTGSDAALDRAFQLAKKAVALDENESYCQFILGHVHLYRRSFDLAEQYHRRAVEMNPNNAEHIADMGGLLTYLGRPEEGLEWLQRARRIDPYFGPAWYWHQLGMAHFTMRRYDQAIGAFERSSTMPPWVHAYVAACHTLADRTTRASEWMTQALRLNPSLSLRHVAKTEPYKNPVDLEHLLDGLRQAGLPE